MTVTCHTVHTDTLSDTEIDQWRAVPVSIVVDIAPACLIDAAIRPIRPATQQPRLVGRAVTARCDTPDFGAVLHALDHVTKGDVLVIATQGRISHAMIGEILCGHLRDKGAVGVICDGAIRDVTALAQWDDFAVYSRAITPRGPDGAIKGDVQATVPFGNCVIAPGDLILGDDDGLCALPAATARAILGTAQEKIATEERWIAALKSGKPVRDVFDLDAPNQA